MIQVNPERCREHFLKNGLVRSCGFPLGLYSAVSLNQLRSSDRVRIFQNTDYTSCRLSREVK